MKYQKINSLFKRDDQNVIIPDQYSEIEFKYLENAEWECTEKIDGTNMRVIITPIYKDGEPICDNSGVHYNTVFDKFEVEIKGKSDEAKVPEHLMTKMHKLFTTDNIYNTFADKYRITDTQPVPNNAQIILYGEGYGVKIQKGGNYISNDVDFILFDVKVGNYWLSRESIEDIGYSLRIKVVPFIGYMTIPEAIAYVKEGFISNISENRNYIAEGLVLKTPVGLLNRNGNRIITKIKYKDFQDLYNKSPKIYQIFHRRFVGINMTDELIESFDTKKDALIAFAKYKENNPDIYYIVKEINKKTLEVYHEIYE